MMVCNSLFSYRWIGGSLGRLTRSGHIALLGHRHRYADNDSGVR